MPVTPEHILQDIFSFYREKELPVLLNQYKRWSESRPLEGCRIIDASPVFRNTCAKYAALLAAGADLTVAVSRVMPHDPEILLLLAAYGIPVIGAERTGLCGRPFPCPQPLRLCGIDAVRCGTLRGMHAARLDGGCGENQTD